MHARRRRAKKVAGLMSKYRQKGCALNSPSQGQTLLLPIEPRSHFELEPDPVNLSVPKNRVFPSSLDRTQYNVASADQTESGRAIDRHVRKNGAPKGAAAPPSAKWTQFDTGRVNLNWT
jgi:hypothetical protein